MRIEDSGIRVMSHLLSHIGFYSWDVPGNSISGDGRYAEIYEIGEQEMAVGVSLELILSRIVPHDREQLAKRIHGALLGDQPTVTAYDIICPSGARKSLISMGSCAHDADGVVSVYIGAIMLCESVDSAVASSELTASMSRH